MNLSNLTDFIVYIIVFVFVAEPVNRSIFDCIEIAVPFSSISLICCCPLRSYSRGQHSQGSIHAIFLFRSSYHKRIFHESLSLLSERECSSSMPRIFSSLRNGQENVITITSIEQNECNA